MKIQNIKKRYKYILWCIDNSNVVQKTLRYLYKKVSHSNRGMLVEMSESYDIHMKRGFLRLDLDSCPLLPICDICINNKNYLEKTNAIDDYIPRRRELPNPSYHKIVGTSFQGRFSTYADAPIKVGTEFKLITFEIEHMIKITGYYSDLYNYGYFFEGVEDNNEL